MHKQTLPQLGSGVYSIPEVARYTGIHPTRVRSWFVQRRDIGISPIFASDYKQIGKEGVVSFLDMIDSLVVDQLRNHGVSMRHIRQVYTKLANELLTEHPFCIQKIRTDGKRVFTEAADIVGGKPLRDVLSDQTFLGYVKKCLALVDYNAEKMASRWRIAKSVIVDPQIQFGKPVIQGTNITTYVLARCFSSNGKDETFVASLFNVTKKQVRHAYEFEVKHGALKAA